MGAAVSPLPVAVLVTALVAEVHPSILKLEA